MTTTSTHHAARAAHDSRHEGAVVDVRDVTRTFGPVTALDGVSLTVEPGELVGLLGPNGAGKTTLLSLLSGLRRPDSGTVRIFGGDPRDPASRASLGTTPQETGLPDVLRVGEVVNLVARHFPDPMPAIELLERFGLADAAGRLVKTYSGGMQRRLDVALGLVNSPQVLFLDEPTLGLDPAGQRQILALIAGIANDLGSTVVLSTHSLAEVEQVCTRVVILNRGRLVADGTVAEVVRRAAAPRRAKVQVPPGTASRAVRVLASAGLTATAATSLGGQPGDLDVLLPADAAAEDGVSAAVRSLLDARVPVLGLVLEGGRLSDAFLAVTEEADHE